MKIFVITCFIILSLSGCKNGGEVEKLTDKRDSLELAIRNHTIEFDSTYIGRWKSQATENIIEVTDKTFYGLLGNDLQTFYNLNDGFFSYPLHGAWDKEGDSAKVALQYNPKQLLVTFYDRYNNIDRKEVFNRYDPEKEELKRQLSVVNNAIAVLMLKEKKKSSKSYDEANGTIIDYCPRCYENSNQAYSINNGLLIKQPNFVKGSAIVCYECAMKMKKAGY